MKRYRNDSANVRQIDGDFKPADIFGLQQKGRIAPGKDADFVFIQPNSSYILTNDDLEYRHKVHPYVGRTIGARITKTILRGDVIYDIEQGFPVAPKGGIYP